MMTINNDDDDDNADVGDGGFNEEEKQIQGNTMVTIMMSNSSDNMRK